MTRPIVTVLAALVVAFALGADAQALSSGGSSSSASTGDSADAAYQEGRKFVKQNNFKAAITKLKKAVAADPKHADAQNLLGYAYRKTGDYDSALVHYNEALALDPDHADAHEYIGEAYLELDDLAKAEEHLVALERICPSGCEQRDELAAQVAAYKASHGG